jgi:hypothetical protein
MPACRRDHDSITQIRKNTRNNKNPPGNGQHRDVWSRLDLVIQETHVRIICMIHNPNHQNGEPAHASQDALLPSNIP